MANAEPGTRLIFGGLILFGVALFLVTFTGLPQLMDNEWRLSAYALDVLENGRWLCPTDATGEVASKPPMLAWLVALAAWPGGRVTRLALYWPTALATLVTTLVLYRAGRAQFGWRAGLFAGFAYAGSYVGMSQMSMARYDGFLALPVTAAALSAFSAWQTGRGWTWCWLFAAFGTLVKGPVVLLLAGGGLLPLCWADRAIPSRAGWRSQGPGLAVFLALTAGWFALAYVEMGPPLIDKMLKRELVGHAMHGAAGELPLSGFHEPTLNFLGVYAPWSLVFVAGIWRTLRRPSGEPAERRFERFLLGWFAVGLLVFSVAAHQRGRLIYPLVPAAALLVGRELGHWTARLRARGLLAGTAVAACLFLAGAGVYHHVIIGGSRRVQRTLAVRELARRLEAVGGREFPLTYLDEAKPLQVWLSTRRRQVTLAEAAVLLAGDEPAFVVIEREDGDLRSRLPAGRRVFEADRAVAPGTSTVRILSNRPALELTPLLKTTDGPLPKSRRALTLAVTQE